MGSSLDTILHIPEPESACGSLMAWYSAIVAQGVAPVVKYHLAVACLLKVIDAVGVLCLLNATHGRRIFRGGFVELFCVFPPLAPPPRPLFELPFDPRSPEVEDVYSLLSSSSSSSGVSVSM